MYGDDDTLNEAPRPRTVAIFICYCPPSFEVSPPEGGFIFVFSGLEPIDGVLTLLTNKFRKRESETCIFREVSNPEDLDTI